MVQRYKKSEDIRALLMDTGEALFAERGYRGVSVRDITDAAQQRGASINYYFSSKENLFKAILERRIEPLATARVSRLAQIPLDQRHRDICVRQIVDAFAGPMLDYAQNGGPGWRNYCVIVANLAVHKQWGENTVAQKYDDHALRFLGALQTVFPDTDPYRIHCCFQFMLSTTLYAVCDNERINTLSDGVYRSDDIARLNEPFLDFVSAGIVATANRIEN